MALFLDIDGVLVPIPEMGMVDHTPDPECIAHLGAILQHHPLDIVLTSTWRLRPSKISELNALLFASGIPIIKNFTPEHATQRSQVDYLDDDPDEQMLVVDRVDEICEWLRDHPQTQWIALDDMDLGVDERMAGHFVHTDSAYGLQIADVHEARALLRAQDGLDDVRIPSDTRTAQSPGDIANELVDELIGHSLVTVEVRCIISEVIEGVLLGCTSFAAPTDSLVGCPDHVGPSFDNAADNAPATEPDPSLALEALLTRYTTPTTCTWMTSTITMPHKALGLLIMREKQDRQVLLRQEEHKRHSSLGAMHRTARRYVAFFQLCQSVDDHRRSTSRPKKNGGPSQKDQQRRKFRHQQEEVKARRTLYLQTTMLQIKTELGAQSALRQILNSPSPNKSPPM